MSEDEIKAVEKLSAKKNESTWNDTIRQIKREEIKDVVVTRQKYITTVLNLIEKQQKELEQEKEKNKELLKEYNKKLNADWEDAISKDKIREFIKDELPDNEICECCDIYDVNGVYIKAKLEKLLE